MNAVSSTTSSPGNRTGTLDLLGAKVREKKSKREKRLGYLSKKELIAEVRQIFPDATVLPNR